MPPQTTEENVRIAIERYRLTHPDYQPPVELECTRCHQIKPVESFGFSKNRGHVYGFRYSQCKDCVHDAHRHKNTKHKNESTFVYNECAGRIKAMIHFDEKMTGQTDIYKLSDALISDIGCGKITARKVVWRVLREMKFERIDAAGQYYKRSKQ